MHLGRRRPPPRLTIGGFCLPLVLLQPSKTVGNAKKASKLSSGAVLTAGKDIKARQLGGWEGGWRGRGGSPAATTCPL